ncbi:hypothetical protein Fleli_1708 [Bernardetia litoralis DSM 6794]|uniref:Outer membrane protein/protective antigen OMA87 n=1 Tax=Bernardetia litoralis (strain ATCC 23117 / DSM 6794 / NBRC 15988 / NCIMB 1366 / Fx l1 / Sio-4) TaxID=880071 RepID=I4AJI1_BERLS|nr:hypothetical protein [Bernardetia litoralis]AFM04116.1 hypothetical protein Fleli_1708 [Bernardetia litoralis DSM 6794]
MNKQLVFDQPNNNLEENKILFFKPTSVFFNSLNIFLDSLFFGCLAIFWCFLNSIFIKKIGLALCAVLSCCVFCQKTKAQKAPYSPSYSVTITLDSIDRMVDNYYKETNDTTTTDKIQRWAAKRKWTKEVASWIISPKKEPAFCPPADVLHYPDWKKQEGKIIGNIDILTLDVFGAKATDTLKTTRNWLEKAANTIHIKTQSSVVKRRYLLFKEGQKLNPDLIKDTERLLRQLRAIGDARIYVKKRVKLDGTFSDTVDIEVITHDIWSLIPSAGAFGFNSGWMQLQERNLLGFGHNIEGEFIFSPDSEQKFGHRAKFESAYLGNSFSVLSTEYWNTYAQKSYNAALERRFLSPSMRWAGGVEVGYRRWLATPLSENDTITPNFFYSYWITDAWGAYSFPIKNEKINNGGRTSIITAAHFTNYYFINQPKISADTNLLYQNHAQMLLSVGLSTRKYQRDFMIYGFGRTEDIPIGRRAVFTFGKSNTDLETRYYAGLELSKGIKTKKLGYVRASLGFGSYLTTEKEFEQGIFESKFTYFSPLLCLGKWRLRQFVRGRYTKGFNRFDREYNDINGNAGIWGISNDQLKGTEVGFLGTESVFFTPWRFLDFQWAFFARADIGVATFSSSVTKSPIFQGYNIGLRMYNERFSFRTLQLRFGFYTGFDDAPYYLHPMIDNVPRLSIEDFDIEKPDVIYFHKGNEGR